MAKLEDIKSNRNILRQKLKREFMSITQINRYLDREHPLPVGVRDSVDPVYNKMAEILFEVRREELDEGVICDLLHKLRGGRLGKAKRAGKEAVKSAQTTALETGNMADVANLLGKERQAATVVARAKRGSQK